MKILKGRKRLRLTRLCISILIYLLNQHSTFAQITIDGKTKHRSNTPLTVVHLNPSEFRVKYSAENFPESIIIDRATSQSTSEICSLSDSINLSKNQGIIKIQGRLAYRNISEKGAIGFFCKATDETGNLVVFNNMDGQITGRRNGDKNFTLTLPFDRHVAKVKWGLYMKGGGELNAREIAVSISSGEFSSEWKSLYADRISIDSNLIHRLSNFIKVWGFLKYHHPFNSKGMANWDSVLISCTPKIFAMHSDKDYQKLISNIINSVGVVSKCDTCKLPKADSLLINYDISGTRDQILGSANISNLRYIENNYRPDKNMYVTYSSRGTPNPEFSREFSDKQILLPDVNYRFLALSRYWNIINYFYPYKYAIGYNWNDVLSKLIPIFIRANNLREYKKAVLLMNASINDSHATFVQGVNLSELPSLTSYQSGITTDNNFTKLPLKIMLYKNSAFVIDIDSAFSATTGISSGDTILSCNGVRPTKVASDLYPFIGASNLASKDHIISRYNMLANIPLEKNQTITLEYAGKNGVTTKNIIYKISNYINYFKNRSTAETGTKNGKIIEIMPDSVLYINPSRIDSSSLKHLREKLNSSKAVILDFRIYPKYAVGKLIPALASKSKPSVKFQWINILRPGVFEKPITQTIQPNKPFQGKVIVLIDENSISQSEFWAMQFKDCSDSSFAIGRTTAGADGDVSSVSIPGNVTLSFSGIRINYPDGTETQRIGIKPDFFIEVNISDEIKGIDTILKTAIIKAQE